MTKKSLKPPKTQKEKQEALTQISTKLEEIKTKFAEAMEIAKEYEVSFNADISEMLGDNNYLEANFDPLYGWNTDGWNSSNC